MSPAHVDPAALAGLVYEEARLLDEKRFDEWYELFTDDAYYWMPLTRGQPDGENYTSLLYEDKLLLRIRIERLKSPHAFSQQQPSFSQHVLQAPLIESTGADGSSWVMRTPFLYIESQLDNQLLLSGVSRLHLVQLDGRLRIRLKKVELVNCDAARYAAHDFLQVLPETAAQFGIEPRTWRYEEAAAEVARLRAAYDAAGYRHGHRAGLLLLNRPEFLFHFIALNGLGVSVVPINADWRSAELEYLIGHSEICIAACVTERHPLLASAAKAVGRPLELTGPTGEAIGRAPVASPEMDRHPDVDSECALLYTSGTMGRPKGCVLANEYYLHVGAWYLAAGGLCAIRPGVERMVTPLPLTHMNAMAYSTMCMLLSGGCLVLLDRFHPRSWWESVRAARASIVHYLGVMPGILLAAPEEVNDRRHAVRFGFGAGVNPRHHAAFEARFGFPLLEAWAMTETGAGAVVIANHEPREVGTACFGTAAADIDCRIVDEAGRDAPPGSAGELWVRHAGPQPRFGFFRRYLKDDAATDEAWKGGWFHTGDLVTRDDSGNMRFLDRRKNLIRRSGENISAVEVESVLSQHPAVRVVGVTAVPDELRGDEVFACVVLQSSATPSETLARELSSVCLERLAYFKAPGYIAFCGALPLTPTEKIQRNGLRELGRELLARGECIDLRSLKRRGSG